MHYFAKFKINELQIQINENIKITHLYKLQTREAFQKTEKKKNCHYVLLKISYLFNLSLIQVVMNELTNYTGSFPQSF